MSLTQSIVPKQGSSRKGFHGTYEVVMLNGQARLLDYQLNDTYTRYPPRLILTPASGTA